MSFTAVRSLDKDHRGLVQYFFGKETKLRSNLGFDAVAVVENTYLVDGIGGVTWVSLAMFTAVFLQECTISHETNYTRLSTFIGWCSPNVQSFRANQTFPK